MSRIILAAVCVMFLIALAALWIDSFFHVACFEYNVRATQHDPLRILRVYSSHGRVCFSHTYWERVPLEWTGTKHEFRRAANRRPHGRPFGFARIANGYEVLGFSYRNWQAPPDRPACRDWSVPYWSLAALAALYPLKVAYGKVRGRRGQGAKGACDVCGYDLRATPDRCPECGTPVPAGHIAQVKPTPPIQEE